MPAQGEENHFESSAALTQSGFLFSAASRSTDQARQAVQIHVNEKCVRVKQGARLNFVRSQFKPDADIVIVNGFPATNDQELAENDRVTLIRRGEIPSEEEFEALLVARHSPGVHERVRSACIGIAGVGGLGSFIALALARTGIGRLILVDHDVVEPSNLNRQQYFVDQIGQPKVDALSDTISRVNPHVAVSAHRARVAPSNVARLFEGVTVMVEAFDDAREKAMLAESFRLAYPDVPLVAASGLAGFGPSNEITTTRRGKSLFLVGDELSAAEPGQGLMAPRVGVAAHHQANAVLRLLLDESPV